jgi:hypothetical protein
MIFLKTKNIQISGKTNAKSQLCKDREGILSFHLCCDEEVQ